MGCGVRLGLVGDGWVFGLGFHRNRGSDGVWGAAVVDGDGLRSPSVERSGGRRWS